MFEITAHCMDCAKFGNSCDEMIGTEPVGTCFVPTPCFIGSDYQERKVKYALFVLKEYCYTTTCAKCMIRGYCSYASCMTIPLCDIDIDTIKLKEGANNDEK